MLKKALFLDKDGVINHNFGYVHKPEKTIYLKGLEKILRLASINDYLKIIITNQAGIGRGYYTELEFKNYMRWLRNDLKENFNYTFDIYFYCPHHPSKALGKYLKNCECRKPGSLMFENAINKFKINPNESIMIGDNPTDLIPAKNVGIKKLFLLNNKNEIFDEAININYLSEINESYFK